VLARAAVLYERVERRNRASKGLTVAAVFAGGVALGLSIRARRLRRSQLRLTVSSELAGLSLGVSGVLP
jgi:hypothetical protein